MSLPGRKEWKWFGTWSTQVKVKVKVLPDPPKPPCLALFPDEADVPRVFPLTSILTVDKPLKLRSPVSSKHLKPLQEPAVHLALLLQQPHVHLLAVDLTPTDDVKNDCEAEQHSGRQHRHRAAAEFKLEMTGSSAMKRKPGLSQSSLQAGSRRVTLVTHFTHNWSPPLPSSPAATHKTQNGENSGAWKSSSSSNDWILYAWPKDL